MKKELLAAAEKVRDPVKNHSFLQRKRLKLRKGSCYLKLSSQVQQ